MALIIFFKPSIAYNKENNLKTFGINGNNNTTIFPLWVLAIIIAIFSYYFSIFVTRLIK